MIREVQTEGRDAWDAAGSDARNPYDPSTWQWEAWQEGYDYAKRIEMED